MEYPAYIGYVKPNGAIRYIYLRHGNIKEASSILLSYYDTTDKVKDLISFSSINHLKHNLDDIKIYDQDYCVEHVDSLRLYNNMLGFNDTKCLYLWDGCEWLYKDMETSELAASQVIDNSWIPLVASSFILRKQ